jgi:methylated-DNA-[protein]-cysteine S-methyltransferase
MSVLSSWGAVCSGTIHNGMQTFSMLRKESLGGDFGTSCGRKGGCVMKHRISSEDRTIFGVTTSLGRFGVALSDRGIVWIDLAYRGRVRIGGAGGEATEAARKASALLQRYAAGEDVPFDVPLDLRKATPFQKAVWRAAASIPYGETRSYKWIAERIGKPGSARAVGQALGANPIPIIIPCHRVVTSAGAIGGFSGGRGLKERLLRREAGMRCGCTTVGSRKGSH